VAAVVRRRARGDAGHPSSRPAFQVLESEGDPLRRCSAQSELKASANGRRQLCDGDSTLPAGGVLSQLFAQIFVITCW
jgi:hypothetical protein